MSGDFPKLTFTLRHDGPVPLGDFTDALTRMQGRYGRYIRQQSEVKQRGEEPPARLLIAEIRQGSIVIDLVAAGAAAQVAMDGVGGINNLVEFGKNLAGLLKGFRTGEVSRTEVSIADCDDARAIIRPVLHSDNGGLTLAVNGDNNVVQPILIRVDQPDAQIIDNRAAILRDALAAPQEERAVRVLFVWKRIEDAPGVESGKRSPDKGIIQSLSPIARQVTFADSAVKEAMYRGDQNPFEVGFVVDVKVLLGPAGPAAYMIEALHDTIDLENHDS